jgi:nucleoid-associated protein YgaU
VAARSGPPGFGGTGSGGPRSRGAGAGLPGSGPRVTGHLRPVPDRPADRAPHAAGPAAEAPRTRRDPTRPGGRPPHSAPARGPARGRCAPPAPPVRLTRRGRRLVAVLVLASGLAGVVLGREVLAPDPGLRLAGESSVVVEQGDTVWSIADRVTGSDEDVRAVVDVIVALNDLEDSVVVPGQVLRVP